MSKKQIDKLMHSLLAISSILMLLGTFFKLQHYPYGDLILSTGIWSSLVIGTIEISHLKKIRKTLEKEASKSN
ncbi:hypothetical protein QUH73_13820 [Labilibaculum sp. K2S]|uniref:hypothetical protein n=1 Tax=Labilibaculum sp. K2S TaxID=3056386 RepID=UPI0025A36565|nr:hypothetical protein [Labilibaculum sp. K2S]MDM8160897.1 hypothetical protein [Labilibaculum sp. K2S]